MDFLRFRHYRDVTRYGCDGCFYSEKLETLGRINIEDLENTWKRVRGKKKTTGLIGKQTQMSFATLVCTLQITA